MNATINAANITTFATNNTTVFIIANNNNGTGNNTTTSSSLISKTDHYNYYFSEQYYYHACKFALWFAGASKSKEEALPMAMWWIYFGISLLLIGAFCFCLSYHYRQTKNAFEYVGVSNNDDYDHYHINNNSRNNTLADHHQQQHDTISGPKQREL